MFVTGGRDHRVHAWTIPEDPTKTSAQEISIKHTAMVQSLLPIRDTSHKLVTAGADCRVNIWDFASTRVVNTFKVSNSVFHLHSATIPYCTLLEVAHRELQFEIRDHRLVPVHPVVRFGFNAEALQSRFVRGDVDGHNFACGDREGNIRVWDIRQANKEAAMIPCFPEHRTMDIAFRRGDIVACSDDFRVKILRKA
ncbi:hypothetical protein PHLGIDRAFT_136398 [Phlebiopsis gigantea 11061_1 CR5-6]|uniref:Uncharacterized protein n=1 Tax=Phlebiopsis gigantea (strain 11061_1 CR5-6) TaxID=745531 RepID=A0A0C3P4C1_PHLG1|nr:hypothetical protein PHLGIDRAFT_136398 [Phlebiopsis gigantea 11061_1 CR5-6]